jgi:hypothetical protein
MPMEPTQPLGRKADSRRGLPIEVIGPRTSLVARLTTMLEHGLSSSFETSGRARKPRVRVRAARSAAMGIGREVRFRELGVSLPAVSPRLVSAGRRMYLVSALKADGTTEPAEVRRRVRSIRARDARAAIFVLLDERNPAAVRAARLAGATNYLGAAAASNREALAWRVSEVFGGQREWARAAASPPVESSALAAEPRVELTAFEEPSPQEVEAARTRAEAEQATLRARGDAVAPALAFVDVDSSRLRNPRSGRLDAKRIAGRLGGSVSRLASVAGVSQQALSARPDSARAQEGLLALARVVAALDEALPPRRVKMWLRAPHARLGGASPLAMLLDGRAETLARMVEGALEGIPD